MATDGSSSAAEGPSNVGRLLTFDVRDVDAAILRIDEFRAKEGFSQCIPAKALLSARAGNLDSVNQLALVGKVASVSIALDAKDYQSAPRRFFSGVICSFTHLRREAVIVDTAGDQSNLAVDVFEIEIAPPMWLLTQRSNCRILSGTVPEIIAEVCDAISIDVDVSLAGERFDRREYCVQYRETDFAFISRLMEQEGLSYYFEHDFLECRLVVQDAGTAQVETVFAEATERANDTTVIPTSIDWNSPNGGIHQWNRKQRLTSSQRRTRDFHFDNSVQISSVSEAPVAYHPYVDSPEQLEVYDYPGGMVLSPKRNLNKIATEAFEVDIISVQGESSNWYLQPGRSFVLSDYYDSSQNVSHVVEYVEHTAYQAPDNWVWEREREVDWQYQNRFRCFPEMFGGQPIRFRPPQTTPRPVVEGPQTATVVGDSSSNLNSASGTKQKVESDKYGRVKVRFHWDEAEDEVKSCWVRVSQAWAGSGYGSWLLPHLGQEVVVSFLEGDPDRPLIVGRVYNQNNRPLHYDHPNASEAVDPTSSPHIAVVARDQVYNEVQLDSTEGRENVLLRSPGSNSYIRVGGTDGIIVKTAGGLTELFEGWDYRLTLANSCYVTGGVAFGCQIGGKVDLMLGGEFAMTVGTKVDVSVGFELSASIAGKFDWGFGTSYSATKEWQIHEADDDVETKAKGQIVHDSRDTLTMVGGPDGGPNGRIMASGAGLVMTCGTGNVADPGGASWATTLASYIAAFTGIAAGAAPAVVAATQVMDNPPSDEELLSESHDRAAIYATGAASLAGSVISAAILAAAARAARTRVRDKSKRHTTVNSSLVLGNTNATLTQGLPAAFGSFEAANGSCTVQSNTGQVTVSGQTGVSLQSAAGPIRLNGTSILLNGHVLIQAALAPAPPPPPPRPAN